MAAGAHWHINKQASDPGNGLENGVQLANGDGTVPLISLGAVCYDGWRSKELNPHGVKARAPQGWRVQEPRAGSRPAFAVW